MYVAKYILFIILYGYGHFWLGRNQRYELKTVQLSGDQFNSIIQLVISNIQPVDSDEE